MIKNIVFDMGRVLVKFEPLKYIAHYTTDEKDTQILLDEVFGSKEWVGLDHGKIVQEQAVESICKRIPSHLHEATGDLIHNWHQYREPIEGMEDIIKDLKARGYNVFVLSNISSIYHELKKTIPALGLIDNDFLSYQWHMLKPTVEFYTAFYAHYRLIPRECLFIDDLPVNIFMAEHTGMQGIVFKGDSERLKTQLEEILEF